MLHNTTYFKRTVGLLLMLIVGACDTGPAASLYEGDPTFSPDPTITSVAPPVSALAGVEEVTITGSNFSTVPSENLVYFDETRVPVISASATQLVVVPPPTPSDNVSLRISVVGAENFSNAISYKLDPAAVTIGAIQSFEELFGIATDPMGNVYASMFVNNVAAGIKVFSPDGTRSDFTSSSFKWDGIQYADDGALIAVRNLRAIFRLPEGAPQETWAVISDAAVKLVALDFDASGNLWVGGSRTDANQPVSLFKVDPAMQITEYPLTDFANTIQITALTIGDGKLYASIRDTDVVDIWTFDISSGSPGTPEKLLAFSADVSAQARILSLAIAASGDLFVGTTLTDPIIVVHPDKSWNVLYPGILEASGLSLAWGPGGTLYMVKGRTSVSGSADLTDADLYKIEVGQEGIR